MDIRIRKVVILFTLGFVCRHGFSVKIKSFTSDSPKSKNKVIRLIEGTKLTITCEIASAGQPYYARIKNENGTAVNSTSDANDSTLTHTINGVTCRHIGELECEVQNRKTNSTARSLLYLMVEDCLPITCKGLHPDFTLVAPLHSTSTLSLCVVVDPARIIDIKIYINGQRFKLNTVHHKFQFDLERNEPSYIHYTVHLRVVDVTAADYGVYNVTAHTGEDYSLTVMAQLDGEGEPCPDKWCRTPNRTCIQLLKAGTSYKKSKRICEKDGGSLFNGTIQDSVQCINSSLNTNISDHILVYTANQMCRAYSVDNHTRIENVECSSISTFSFACQIPYWRHLGNDIMLYEPVPYASIGSSLIMVIIASFIGVVCYRKRVSAALEKTRRESVYNTLYEDGLDSVRDNDNGNEYDVTEDELGLVNVKTESLKRESIKPAPPPRASGRNKELAIHSDKSVYDVCGVHNNDQFVNDRYDQTYDKIVGINNEDAQLRENDLVSPGTDKTSKGQCNETLLDQHRPHESDKQSVLLNTKTDVQNSTLDYSPPLLAQEVHEYSGYVKDYTTKDNDLDKRPGHTYGFLETSNGEDSFQVEYCNTLDVSPNTLNGERASMANDEDSERLVNELNKSESLDLEDHDSLQGSYSTLLDAAEEYFYALFEKNTKVSASLRQEYVDDSREMNNDQIADEIANITKSSSNYDFDLRSDDNFMTSCIELKDKTNQAIYENQSSEFIHVKHSKNTIVSNTTDNGEHEYITPVDTETYPVMKTGCDNQSATDDNYDENVYQVFDGAFSRVSHERDTIASNITDGGGDEYITPVDNETYYVVNNGGDFKTEIDDSIKGNAYPLFGGASIHAKHEKDNSVSNPTDGGEDEYITPVDDENYPLMVIGGGITTRTDDINQENFYLQFDGNDCDESHDENHDGYMTWDGGDVSCDDDCYSNDSFRTNASNTQEHMSDGKLLKDDTLNGDDGVVKKKNTR